MDKQMRSNSSYQKPIKALQSLPSPCYYIIKRFSLCHEAKKARHLRSTRNTDVWQRARFFLQQTPVPHPITFWSNSHHTKHTARRCDMQMAFDGVAARLLRFLHCRLMSNGRQFHGRLKNETTRVNIFRTKGTAVFRALPSSFYHVFDALELIILLPCIGVLAQSQKPMRKGRWQLVCKKKPRQSISSEPKVLQYSEHLPRPSIMYSTLWS